MSYGSNARFSSADVESVRYHSELGASNFDLDSRKNRPRNGRGLFFALLIAFIIAGVMAFAGLDVVFLRKVSNFFLNLDVLNTNEPLGEPMGDSFVDTDVMNANEPLGEPLGESIVSTIGNSDLMGESMSGPSSDRDQESSQTDDMYITAINEYGQFSAPYPWLDDVEGSQLVEPYKTTTLTAYGTLARNATLHWSTDYEFNKTYVGSSISMMFQRTGTFILNIEAFDSETGEIRGRYSTYLISKYVKRELRSLSVADREKFLDAAAVLWKYGTEDGRKIYGDSFTSASTFVEEHALASNDIRCDSYHEGSGFITHHLAITNSFEASLRSVDPSVTLPYWDFSIEGQQIADAGADPSYFLELTPFLSDTWFGSVDDDGHIQDSRWAHVQMPKVTRNSTVNPNSFGYLRSYWNNNNDAEITRHLFKVCGREPVNKRIPDCSSHYDVLNTDDLAAFQLLSPSDGHGPVHVQIGGIAGPCVDAYQNFTDYWSDILDANMTTEEVESLGYNPEKGWEWGLVAPRRAILERELIGEYFHVYRSLWRSHMCARDSTPNLLKCPESCSSNTTVEECACGVEDLVDGTTDWENVFYCVLSEKNRDLFMAVMPEQLVEDMVTMVASTPIVEGEMLEAASPADILFWVVHPTLDRLLTAKRLPSVSSMGGVDFAEWDSVDGSGETWLSYSYYNKDADTNPYFPDAYTCVGHSADDQVLPDRLPYIDGFPSLADTNRDGVITNWEYFIAIDPNNMEGVDYVYDSFEWDHCASGALQSEVEVDAGPTKQTHESSDHSSNSNNNNNNNKKRRV